MTIRTIKNIWTEMQTLVFVIYQVVLAFFRQIPQAILRAIIAHMKLTDPDELDRLVQQPKLDNDSSPQSPSPDKGTNTSTTTTTTTSLQRKKIVPLTPARIEFLMSLLAPVHKPV